MSRVFHSLVARCMPAAALLGCCAGVALAQKGIDWSRNVEASIAESKRTLKPLMMFVEGSIDERDDRTSDERRKAFMDPRVLYVTQRYIPVRADRSVSKYRGMFDKLGVDVNANLMIVFVSPKGDKLDDFYALHQADSFAQKMTLVYRVYRKKVLEDDLAPVFNDEKASAADLKKALGIVESLAVLEADQLVIKTLDRRNVGEDVAEKGIAALGAISTTPAVERLLNEAAGASVKRARLAADALERCTPAAAEDVLVKALDETKIDARFVAAYKAIARITKLSNAKPDKFWEGDNEKVKRDEIRRTADHVEKRAADWRRKFDEYR